MGGWVAGWDAFGVVGMLIATDKTVRKTTHAYRGMEEEEKEV